MRTTKKIVLIAAAVLFTLSACEKKDDFQANGMVGTYAGTITATMLKSASTANGNSYNATAEVTKLGKNQIQVHFWGGNMDTTLMLNYFNNHDSIMVCLNDSDYEHMYSENHISSGMGGGMMGGNSVGGMMGSNSGGGMMGNSSGSGTEWKNHMNESHQGGNAHYGGFDMTAQTFGYSFRMQRNDLRFQGVKKGN